MNKVAIGINLRSGMLIKRLWFEIQDNTESKNRFKSLSQKINSLDSSLDWKELLQAVENMLAANGIYRIAK